MSNLLLDIGGFVISSGGLVNDDNTAYIICINSQSGCQNRLLFPASSGVGLGYFYNRTTLGTNLYGVYIDTRTSSDSSLYFSCALYVNEQLCTIGHIVLDN